MTTRADRIDQSARHRALALMTVLAGCLAADQIRLWYSFGRNHTDDDQSLLWLAARELGHLRLHQPNFYGQTYNVVFDVAPATLLHAAGVSLPAAVPLATTVLATACWVVLAGAAWRTGHTAAAGLALAAPVVMSTGYLLLLDAPRGVLTGDLLACGCAALTIAGFDQPVALAIAAGAGAFAIQMEPSGALVVFPALVAGAVRIWPTLRARANARVVWAWMLWLVLALEPAFGWLLWTHRFYRASPQDNRAPDASIRPFAKVFAASLRHPQRYVDLFVPEVWHWAPLGVALVLVVLAAALATRRLPVVAAAATLVALLAYALATPKFGQAFPGVFLSGSRLLLTLPFALWLLVYLAIATGAEPRRLRVPARSLAILLVLVVAAGATTALRQIQLETRVDHATAGDASHAVRLQPVAPLVATCHWLATAARTTGTDLVVTDNRSIVYACAALEPQLSTFSPRFDRRGWVVGPATLVARRSLLLAATAATLCPKAAHLGYGCRSVGNGFVVLHFPPQTATATLQHLGLDVVIGRL